MMSGICLEICHQKIQIKTIDKMLIVIEGGWYVDFCYVVLPALFKMVHVKELKRSPQTTMPSKTDKVEYVIEITDKNTKLKVLIMVTFTDL